MRHRVVDMQHLKLIFLAHLRHFHRKRQRVIRILEQIVIVDDHRMEEQPRDIHGQAERTFVTDEMHFMPALHQLLAQGGGQNAAAADRGITGDANLHGQKRRALRSVCASESNTSGSLGNKAVA